MAKAECVTRRGEAHHKWWGEEGGRNISSHDHKPNLQVGVGAINDMNRFRLRFPEHDVNKWSECCDYPPNPAIENEIVPRVKETGYLIKPDFLTICRWKTPRSQPRCASNRAEFIKEISRVALSTPDERLRIEVWTLLNGVNWPTASTLLFWLHNEEYPILDFRALWSVGYAKPPKYDFDFWSAYVNFCRRLARKCNVSVRTLDQALWQYSSQRQRK